MKHYFEFKPSGKSFSDHDIEPSEFLTGIGAIAIAFSELENCLSKSLTSLINSPDDIGRIVVTEMSFRAKVNLFSSLVRHSKENRSFAVPNYLDINEVLKDLCANVSKAEEFRNTMMHSFWSGLEEYDPERVIRYKSSAKSKHGFRETREDIDTGYLLDIAEFIESVAADIIGFVFGIIETGYGPYRENAS